MRDGKSLVVVCGLAAEARVAAAPGLRLVLGGGDGPGLADRLAEIAPEATALLSFGMAGGLAPGFPPGTVFIADSVIAPDGATHRAEAAWAARLSATLDAPRATLAAADFPIARREDKSALHIETGAATVDMETHIVGHIAERFDLPWGAVRVVTDPADRSLPPAAVVGMRTDGSIDVVAVLRSLVAAPRQIPALLRTARDARAAFAALLRCRQLLGPGFARLDL